MDFSFSADPSWRHEAGTAVAASDVEQVNLRDAGAFPQFDAATATAKPSEALQEPPLAEASAESRAESPIVDLGLGLIGWALSRLQARPQRYDNFGDQLASLD